MRYPEIEINTSLTFITKITMKPRHVVLLIVIAALLIAWFTKPGKEDLQKFLHIDETGIGRTPLIEYTNGYVYSKFNVSWFDNENEKETYING